ncbi:NAD(P)/FAD-dependent oxidoreductase [Metabacillus indicus]|uniref:phytoene desaturase family protein n=1 Tax=Metabacillus indicus TaxID=246786 RepID=UPI002A043091|nr:NAD(P)/FAD-dependent oxidoreductase [Metabacillus indicus]MDX8289157.1 NAD(P)/FAD-dependent oxidoreductase [Metabacillus indicus]
MGAEQDKTYNDSEVKTMAKRTIIIGGGIGGLTAAVFLAKQGAEVTVLEASNEWGGCAGKFQRGKFLYPAGATLGMGFEQGGVHDKLFRELHLSFQEHSLLDVIMDIHLPEKTISYYRDRALYLKEAEKHFPHLTAKIRAFYSDIWKTGAEVKKLIDPLPVLPPKTAFEWGKLLTSLKPSTLGLLPHFQSTMAALLKKHGLQNERDFVHLIDAQLIDSMQTTSADCSAILGAYALTVYHDGAFYVNGGLYQIAEHLAAFAKDRGAVLKKRSWVKSIHKENGRYRVTDQKNKTYDADYIICNLPLPGFISLLSADLIMQLSKAYRKKQPLQQWGTMTLYLTVKEEVIPENFPLFHQVMDNDSGDMTEGHHLFLSVSKKEDARRAPAGYRTMTASTHTDLKLWDTKEKYDRYKEVLTNRMLRSIETAIPRLQDGLTDVMPGAPGAWETFTKRPGGMVGGYPQTLEHSLFNSLSHRTGIPGIYLCGDSVFPGAGTIGVSVSGYHASQSVLRDLRS